MRAARHIDRQISPSATAPSRDAPLADAAHRWLAVALLAELGALLLLAVVVGPRVSAMLGDPALARWDAAIVDRLHASATPGTLTAVRIVSWLGSPSAMSALAALGFLALRRAAARPAADASAAARTRLLRLAWPAAFAGGAALDLVVKRAVHRPRPAFATAFVHNGSFSFPSGHAVGATVGAGMLAYALVATGRAHGARRAALVVGCALFVAVACLTRIYLGVHWPSDMAGGVVVGGVWVALVVAAVEAARGRARRRTVSGADDAVR